MKYERLERKLAEAKLKKEQQTEYLLGRAKIFAESDSIDEYKVKTELKFCKKIFCDIFVLYYLKNNYGWMFNVCAFMLIMLTSILPSFICGFIASVFFTTQTSNILFVVMFISGFIIGIKFWYVLQDKLLDVKDKLCELDNS